MLREKRMGCICYFPLAGGILTGKYLDGIPANSRVVRDPRYLKPQNITEDQLRKVAKFAEIADRRGQTLSQLALSWVLRHEEVTSALIGASCPEQIIENI